MKDFVYCSVIVAMGMAWLANAMHLRSQAIDAQCRFELIDPIRAEADVPLSDCCKDWLKNQFGKGQRHR